MYPLEITTEDFLIVCEGKSDWAFLKHLIEFHGITGFTFAYPERDEATGTGGNGKSSFHEALDTIKTIRGREKLSAILILGDSDNDPAEALRFIQRQIRLSEGYGTPVTFNTPAQAGDTPPIIISTLPSNERRGNLEALVLDAIPSTLPDVWQCLEDYFECSPASEWENENKQWKMKMQCVIAAICFDDPTCAMSYIWSKPTFRALLRHQCFMPLVDFLRDLPSLLNAEGE